MIAIQLRSQVEPLYQARRVLLVDGHALVRAGLRLILARAEEATRFEEVGSYAEAQERLRSDGFDLVLMDPLLPDRSGPEELRELLSLARETPVVVVSGEWDPELVSATLALGVRAFIPKTATPELMLAALGVVASGGVYAPADVLPAVGSRQTSVHLSARQRDVLRHLVEGLTNKEIAVRLGTSVSTVRVHIQAVFRLLGVCNRTQACQVALRRKLVPALGAGGGRAARALGPG